ncbi:uncharacterized protein BDZ83DRAFT_347439 [Colletotrichum acutatum]|uniref:Uncharacterized protein n=1 Tax=Glomerella acutata TaxID=27357 RepID=A0AAD8UJV6_GLOAC|nr:uncharacterized protein BDZ83DRAFT_347439 [Colletotrichum acutatum]KAK1724593.1 hypothetical protein BDZ83DRAFT_347439 [Colletotrichum acutatum]
MPNRSPPTSPPTLLHPTADHRNRTLSAPTKQIAVLILLPKHLTLPLSAIFAVLVPPPPSPQLSFTAGVPCFPSADLPHSAPCFIFFSPKSHGEAHKLRQATQNTLSYQQSFRRKSYGESPVNYIQLHTANRVKYPSQWLKRSRALFPPTSSPPSAVRARAMRSSAPATTARRDPTWYILYPPFSFSAALDGACRVPRPAPALSRDRQNTALCSSRTATPASLCHFFHAEYLKCRTTLGYLLYLDDRG